MSFMTRRFTVLAILVASLSLTASAATPNSFLLVSSTSGKTVGHASFSIDKTKIGYKIHGRFEYHISQSLLPKAPDSTIPAPTATSGGGKRGGGGVAPAIREGQFTEEYKIDANGSFLSGYTQNIDSQLLTAFEPNKTRTEVTIHQTQAGIIGLGREVPLPKPDFLFAPDFDPAPIQMLITTALTHPHSDSFYLLLDPIEAAVKPGDETFLVAIQPVPGTRNGTLDGKPITLHHLLMNYHTGRADLFIDDSGDLMEAQMGTLQIDYVRTNFALLP
jgi:hypothetical protein